MIKASKPALRTPRADEGVQGKLPIIRYEPEDILRRQAWTDDRFGFFIHWGLSAIPAGVWQGRPVGGLSEWIQFKARISNSAYGQLAAEFNPVDFNAREWVRMAAEAGAKYLVFTAKHHDGFAIYHSHASSFNVVDATPFARDPLAEIAEACAEYGLMLGLYYSQTIDWEDPDAVGPQCNDWDFDPAKGDFQRYWQRKAMPQLRELLGNYGDIGLLWFDMPKGIPVDCAKEASDLVRTMQPGAVINSRLGWGAETDYQSMDDNYFNNHLPERDWETAATTNDSWGFSDGSAGWKPVESLCEALAYAVSRGGNFLLNVGPDASGRIPPEAVRQFRGIGSWMERTAAGIHGSGPSPFAGTFDWGCVTTRERSIFLHVSDSACTEAVLPGLAVEPTSVIDLARREPVSVRAVAPAGVPVGLAIALPTPTDTLPRAVELKFAELPVVDQAITQAPGRGLRLDVWTADAGEDGHLRWKFNMAEPGEYQVVLLSKQTHVHFNPQWWAAGQAGTLSTESGRQDFVLGNDGEEPYPFIHYWKLVRSEIGRVVVVAPGRHELAIEDLCVVDSKWDDSGVNLVGIRLEPIRATEAAAQNG